LGLALLIRWDSGPTRSSFSIATFAEQQTFQAIVADVAVDPEVGKISVLQLYFVYDVTTIINPLITKAS
jgi:CO/xanthine dehydrogenase Mo-binding subunit